METKKEVTDNKNNHDGASGSQHHQSWFSVIIDRIQDLDVEFPLSGGEDGHPHVVHKRYRAEIKQEPVAPTPVAVEPKKVQQPVQKQQPKQEHHGNWFSHLIEKIQDLDVDFPLSGGEHTRHAH